MAAIPPPEMETIPQRAVKMANAGLSYSQIARKLRRCKATIYNYIRQEKERAATPAATLPDVYQPLFDFIKNEFDILPLRSDMDEMIRLAKEISGTEILDN